MQEKIRKNLRHFYYEYQSEFIFGAGLTLLVIASYLLSPLIPNHIFRAVIAPIQNTAIITVTLINAWAMIRHHNGIRIRRIYALIMAALSVLMIAGMIYRYEVNREFLPAVGMFSFEGWEMLVGDLIAWLLLAYPSELLRPGWLNWKNALTRLLPVIIVGVIDALTPWDLRWLLAIVPVVWMVLMFHHLQRYRKYSEDNFGSVEETDEQWIIRYLVMMLVLGGSYGYLCITDEPNRLFTQQWLLFFVLVYTSDQAIFRAKPWMEQVRDENGDVSDEIGVENVVANIEENTEYRRALEQWMRTEKPYLKSNFKLYDLMEVVPINRTYLSQFIKDEYDCTFYQLVTNFRIEEAMRVMRANPGMRVQDVAEKCGFSSPTVFGRVFARETGLTPTEWLAQNGS